MIHGENQYLITAVGRIDPAEMVKIQTEDDRFLSASFSQNALPIEAGLVVWQGSVNHLSEFKNKLADLNFQTPDPEDIYSEKRWVGKVYTSEIRSPDTAAFVTEDRK